VQETTPRGSFTDAYGIFKYQATSARKISVLVSVSAENFDSTNEAKTEIFVNLSDHLLQWFLSFFESWNI
jgi:hypothetical protein